MKAKCVYFGQALVRTESLGRDGRLLFAWIPVTRYYASAGTVRRNLAAWRERHTARRVRIRSFAAGGETVTQWNAHE